MVAMNPQTWEKDVAEIEPGGYLFYDSTKPLPTDKFRDDVNVIGMPLMEICNATYADPRQRQLFKNIIYVGRAGPALLDIEIAEVEKLIARAVQGQGEAPRAQRARRCTWVATTRRSTCRRIGLQVKRSDRVGNRVFLEGNNAAALGCVYGGATVAAWYPITPSSSMAEAFAQALPQVPHRSRFRQGALRDRAGRGRAGLHRHRDRRRVERRARVHLHLGTGHLAHAGVHRARLLRRDSRPSSSTCSARVPPPACPRVRSKPTCCRAHMPRTATPSTCCSFPRIRRRASRWRRRPSTWPTACRRRSSCCWTSTSA